MSETPVENPASQGGAETTSDKPTETQATETKPAETAKPVESKPAEAAETSKPAGTAKPEKTKAETKTEKTKAEKPTEKPAEKAQPQTVLDNPESAEPVLDPADWPSDWREKGSRDDAKRLAYLKRFASPLTLIDALFATRQKLSSGEYIKALGENPSDEDLAEYRKSVGIPEKPEDYDITLSEGLKVDDADKPVVAEYLKFAHATNQTEAQVKSNLEWYLRTREQEMAAIQQANSQKREETLNALRAEWGNEYLPNINIMKGVLDAFGEEAKAAIQNARGADGTAILNDPAVIRALVWAAREINPVASVMPGSTGNAANAIADEIGAIEKQLADYDSEYWKGPFVDGTHETRLQKLYRELL